MPATSPASKAWPSSTSSSTLSESVSSTFDNPWVSPDCPAECAPRPRWFEVAGTSRDVTSGDRRVVRIICFGRERLLDRDTFFPPAAVLRRVPVLLPADFFLGVVFFLAMQRSLSPDPAIAPCVDLPHTSVVRRRSVTSWPAVGSRARGAANWTTEPGNRVPAPSRSGAWRARPFTIDWSAPAGSVPI
jgi:hypothetical protein